MTYQVDGHDRYVASHIHWQYHSHMTYCQHHRNVPVLGGICDNHPVHQTRYEAVLVEDPTRHHARYHCHHTHNQGQWDPNQCCLWGWYGVGFPIYHQCKGIEQCRATHLSHWWGWHNHHWWRYIGVLWQPWWICHWHHFGTTPVGWMNELFCPVQCRPTGGGWQ